MLKELFISEVRVRMLKLFLLDLDTDSGLHVREITRRVGAEINAVRRELTRLTKLKMLKRDDRGNRVYYSLREGFPLKSELIGLLAKEEGLGRLIIKNQRRIGRVKYAILSKEFLIGRRAKPNEVDILFVGNVSVEAVKNLLKVEEARLGHDINYTVMGDEEFEFRKAKRDGFIMSILVQPYIMLIGDEMKFAHFPRG